MKTTLAKKESVIHDWKIVDASGQILGRLAVQIANALRGRNKPTYTPHVDTGDYVIVVNADQVKLTGSKEDQKKYMFYSGYMGNEKYRTVADFRENRPEFIITNAVKGMLPKNKLSRQMLTRLRVFRGEEHPHSAQQPESLFSYPHLMTAKAKTEEFIATGRRKTSTARVRIRPGSGSFTINNRDFEDYCSTEQQKKAVVGPLSCVEMNGQVDVSVNVSGGGGTGQSGAIRHGLSRALEKMNGDLRIPLKKSGSSPT